MVGSILSFLRPSGTVACDWSAQEIAEFYRVEASLVQAGISVSAEQGVTDEGDPWFVFCRSTDGEVILHFARIDRSYLIVSEVAGQSFSGRDFRELLKRFIDANPRLVPLQSLGSFKLVLHPAALLAAAVAAALFQMPGSEAIASEIDHKAVDKSPSQKSLSLREILGRVEFSVDQHIAAVIATIIGLSGLESFRTDAGDAADFARLLDVSQNLFGAPRITSSANLPVADSDDHPNTSNAMASGAALANYPAFTSGAGVENQEQQGSASLDNFSRFHDLGQSFPEVNDPSRDPSYRMGQPSDVADLGNVGSSTDKFSIDRSSSQLSHSSSNGGATEKIQTSHDASHLLATTTPDSGGGSDVSTLSVPQLALATVSNDLVAASRTAPTLTLHSDVSVHDLIGFAATIAFGADAFHGILDVIDHATLSVNSSLSADRNAEVFLSQSFTQDPASRTEVALALSQTVPVRNFDAAADAIVNAFVRENTFEVLNTNRNVVLFDLDSSHYTGPDFLVRTWTMNDGSTISVVGHLAHQGAAYA